MFGIEAVLIQGLFKLLIAFFGIVMARTTLYWFDKYLVNTSFTQWLEKANDQTKATYYAGRFIAVCLVIGLALS